MSERGKCRAAAVKRVRSKFLARFQVWLVNVKGRWGGRCEQSHSLAEGSLAILSVDYLSGRAATIPVSMRASDQIHGEYRRSLLDSLAMLPMGYRSGCAATILVRTDAPDRIHGGNHIPVLHSLAMISMD